MATTPPWARSHLLVGLPGIGQLFPIVHDSGTTGPQAVGMTINVRPRLVVTDVDEAVSFYVSRLGAVRGARYADPSGHVVHAELRIGESELSLTQARADWGLHAPMDIGGSPLLLTLTVPDALNVGRRMQDGGATVVVPVLDRPYGKREGRVRDPFGHLWVISQDLAGRTPALREIFNVS